MKQNFEFVKTLLGCEVSLIERYGAPWDADDVGHMGFLFNPYKYLQIEKAGNGQGAKLSPDRLEFAPPDDPEGFPRVEISREAPWNALIRQTLRRCDLLWIIVGDRKEGTGCRLYFDEHTFTYINYCDEAKIGLDSEIVYYEQSEIEWQTIAS